jgi:hypothetical protein
MKLITQAVQEYYVRLLFINHIFWFNSTIIICGMLPMEIKQIISALEIYDGKYKRVEIDEAIQKQDEITPYLLDILQEVYDNPQKYLSENPG